MHFNRKLLFYEDEFGTSDPFDRNYPKTINKSAQFLRKR